MPSGIAVSSKAAEDMFAKLREMQREASGSMGAGGQPGAVGGAGLMDGASGSSSTGMSFMQQLQAGVAEVNQAQKTADKMGTEVASGKTGNLHETMLAISTAELQFNLMVQVRNRALEAYQEVMRMQV